MLAPKAAACHTRYTRVIVFRPALTLALTLTLLLHRVRSRRFLNINYGLRTKYNVSRTAFFILFRPRAATAHPQLFLLAGERETKSPGQ